MFGAGCLLYSGADQIWAHNTSLVADIANIVEVSGSAGIGSHGEVQVDTVELSGGYNIITFTTNTFRTVQSFPFELRAAELTL
jgi:hypothetical protein